MGRQFCSSSAQYACCCLDACTHALMHRCTDLCASAHARERVCHMHFCLSPHCTSRASVLQWFGFFCAGSRLCPRNLEELTSRGAPAAVSALTVCCLCSHTKRVLMSLSEDGRRSAWPILAAMAGITHGASTLPGVHGGTPPSALPLQGHRLDRGPWSC